MDLEQLKKEALKDLEKIRDLAELELTRIKHLGRSSQLNAFLRGLKDRSDEERRKLGALANELKQQLEDVLDAQKKTLSHVAGDVSHHFDISRPAPKFPRGTVHILEQVQEQLLVRV